MSIPIKKKFRVGGQTPPPPPIEENPSTYTYLQPFGYGEAVTGGALGPIVTPTTYSQLKTILTNPNYGPARIKLTTNIYGPGQGSGEYGFYCKGGDKTIVAAPGVICDGFGIWYWPDTALGEVFDNVIMRNLKFQNMPLIDATTTKNNRDYITFKGIIKNLWVDHCEFTEAPGVDGCVDATDGVDLITMSYSKFQGNNDKTVNFSEMNRSTIGFNWFKGNLDRNPRCGRGYHDVICNYYSEDIVRTGWKGAGQSSLGLAQVRSRKNYFDNYPGRPLSSVLGPDEFGTPNSKYGGYNDDNTNHYAGVNGTNDKRGVPNQTYVPEYDSTKFELASGADVKTHLITENRVGQVLTLAQMGF